MKKRLFSFNSELDRVTGVQKVLMDVDTAVAGDYQAKVVGTIPFEDIHENIAIEAENYIRLRNPFIFYRSTVIVHERKYLLLFWILNNLLFQQIKIVYVHHNIFDNLRLMTILPKNIVSISERSTENLVEYFGAKEQNITKIYNTVRDIEPQPHQFSEDGKVNIIYVACVTSVKRQVEIYMKLRGKIDPNVTIHFAGVGEQFDTLKGLTSGDPQFNVLGFVSDVYSKLQSNDYMMLFSEKEGLPISLIEAAMCYTPIICNDVGGNTEIAKSGENGFVVDEWDDLISTLNSLPNVGRQEYIRMSQRSREIYQENFTFDRFKERYLELLSRLK